MLVLLQCSMMVTARSKLPENVRANRLNIDPALTIYGLRCDVHPYYFILLQCQTTVEGRGDHSKASFSPVISTIPLLYQNFVKALAACP